MNQLDAHPVSDIGRRNFVKGAAVVTGFSLVSGITLVEIAGAKASDEVVTSQVRWGLLINTEKCNLGCNACVTACNQENGITQHQGREQTDAQWIRKLHLRNNQTGSEHDLPMMCQHCEKPPCVDVCPTGASFKRADGIVLVDKHICIGCRYCMMACPYKARSFIHEVVENQKPDVPRGKGTVESCTLCVHRVDAHGAKAVPACAEACNREGHQAILFGDLKDKNSAIAQQMQAKATTQVRADLGLNTGVRYQGI